MDRQAQTDWDSWREQIWSTYVRLETVSDDDAFYGRVARPQPGSARLSHVISTRQITERLPSHLRSDPQEMLIVAVQLKGEGGIEQEDRSTRLTAGDFGFYETARPYKLTFEGPFEQLILKLPRRLLDCRMPNLNRLTGRRYDARAGAGAVAISHVRRLAEIAGGLDDATLQSFETGTAELLATAIQLAEGGAPVEERARLEALLRRLARQLDDPGLNPERFATREGLSLRTLQRLFQIEGTTFTRWVLARRLERVAEDLRGGAHRERSVTDIALGWGFNDLSHFSRAFRERYGVSPRGWRAGG